MASKKSNLTAKERKAYQEWAQKELVKPFLDAMSAWKGQAGARKKRSVTSEHMKPIPCHPDLADEDICITPFPPPPPPPPLLGKKLPPALWPKVQIRFKFGP